MFSKLFSKLITKIRQHKIASAVILLIIAGGYYGYKTFFSSQVSVQYNTQATEKTTITVSVSGSGQVSELNSIDLKPGLGTSNTVISKVNFKTGDLVKTGDVIAILDQKNSLSSLNQVRSSLTSARANLANVLAGPTA
ncbi:MAG: biotin/lipoyl-binding protein, partial [Candidatus Falkowbacteria bacterium]|nr:biotin/lipoyl-binding protein [Candidatus Falkowbacteria bacterium]